MANLRVPKNHQSPYDATSLLTYLSKSTIDGVCTGVHMISAVGNIVVAVTDWQGGLTGVPGYPGVTFKHAVGISTSKADLPSDISAANIEADFFVNAEGMQEDEIESGKWDHGAFTLFITNPNALNMGQIIIAKGFFGQFEQRDRVFQVELLGINEALKQVIGKVTERECDADYGDARCGLDLVARGEVHTGALTSVVSRSVFRDTSRTEAAEYFDNGRGMWLTGDNTGFPFHVHSWDAATKEFTLRQSTPYLPAAGDTYTVNRGCKKRKVPDCLDRDNVINFRGTPDVPTGEEFLAIPDA